MLDRITIQCPACAQTTEIGVSSNRDRGFCATACRKCRRNFVALTTKDGTIELVDPRLDSPDQKPRLVAVFAPAGGRSGYRIEPPERLGIFDRGYPPAPPEPGLSDAELASVYVVRVGQALRKEDGSPRDPRVAARFVGWRAVWVAQLQDALRVRLTDPPPLSYPPGIFVSYRWGSPEENQWVADLAHELKRRGYPVLFDRDEPQENVDVPQIVSRIADCRYFIAVIDPGYNERLLAGSDGSTRDGWVFDEVNTAFSLENSGHLRVLGFLRMGNRMSGHFRPPKPGEPGNTLDVRTAPQLAMVLDDLFPSIDDAPPAEVVTRARALLHESHAHVCAGRFEQAFYCGQELAELLPAAVDGRAQQVRVALRAGAAKAGLACAQEALALAPGNGELLLAAGSFAGMAANPRAATEYLGLFLETCGARAAKRELASAHHSIGSSLDDLGQIEPALAHLEIARRLSPTAEQLVTLGYVYLRAGDPPAAITALREALVLDAAHVNGLLNLAIASVVTGRFDDARELAIRLERVAPSHPQLPKLHAFIAERSAPDMAVPRDPGLPVHCSECAAKITLAPPFESICARCGAVVSNGERECPCCGSDGRVVLLAGAPSTCPYCRQGVLAGI